MKLLVSPSLAGTFYEDYHDAPLNIPDHPFVQPSREALEQHRQASGL
jgi:hypothetical protein